MEHEYVSLRGPVEREEAGLVLRIPLDAGGEQLRLVCAAISEIDGDDLVISIPDWLASKIEVAEGTEVHVDDRGGKLNIAKVVAQ
jgi:hypothetical protein